MSGRVAGRSGWTVWVAVAALAASTLLLVATRSQDRARPSDRSASRDPGRVRPPPTAALHAISQRQRPAVPPAEPETVAARAPARSAALRSYLKSSVYPPTSRPLRASQRDLIEHNRRHERPRPAFSEAGTTILFTGDRYWVSGDQPLTTWVEVRRSGVPVEPDAVRGFIATVDAAAEAVDGTPAPIDYALEGDRHVNVLDLSSVLPDDRAVRVRVSVEADLGGSTETAFLHITWTPPAAVPARFTGRLDDRIDRGSLLVNVGVEVYRSGWYLIDANLYDADDRPVAWARFKGELSSGDQVVPLEFFGKAILDADPTPPFRVGELRGARYVEGRDPDHEQMVPLDGRYETETAELGALSAAPWDSEHKRAKLRRLGARVD